MIIMVLKEVLKSYLVYSISIILNIVLSLNFYVYKVFSHCSVGNRML
jgi:hypothetical protein